MKIVPDDMLYRIQCSVLMAVFIKALIMCM